MRVYTTRAAWFLAVLVLLTPAAGAQMPTELTIDPQMVKGPAQAAVTIVEFSDYQ